MTARTHDAIAFASLVTAATLYPPASLNLYTLFAAIIGNNIGALIPDIDQASNRLWDLVPGGDRIDKVLSRLFYKHRTLTHSLLGLFLIFKSLEWLLPRLLNEAFVNVDLVFWSIIIGYASHLVADAFTKEGLPLLFPLKIKIGLPPIKAFRLTTDSWVERLVVLPGVAIYLFWFINQNKATLLALLHQIR
ncbi:MAG: metal-dependent hydrolase [Candidatus Chisholmbacteria bacterium]|nr:metal-dependent hydrolase [Candidatus Chisholmbacteria bacterium]